MKQGKQQMKARCNREQFLKHCKLAMSVTTSRREFLEVLRSVKMIVEMNPARIILVAGNLDTNIRTEWSDDVLVDEPGECLLPIAHMLHICAAHSGVSDMYWDSSNTDMRVTLDHSRYIMHTRNADEFPSVAAFDAIAYHEISSEVLSRQIRRVRIAADSIAARYALNGVLFEFTENGIASVATDGRRMALQESPATVVGEHAPTGQTIVPIQSLNLVLKVLEEGAVARIGVVKSEAVIACGMTTLRCRLADGVFPRWRSMIPTLSDTGIVSCPVGTFARTFEQGRIMASKADPVATLRLSPDRLEVSAVAPENGESRAEMPVAFGDEYVTIKINPELVQDMFRELDEKSNLLIHTRDKSRVVFTTEDGFACVVMAMEQTTPQNEIHS